MLHRITLFKISTDLPNALTALFVPDQENELHLSSSVCRQIITSICLWYVSLIKQLILHGTFIFILDCLVTSISTFTVW